MRNIFQCIEVLIVSGYFNTALPADGTVKIQRSGVIKFSAVDPDIIIMEPLIHWPFCCTNPGGVCGLSENRPASSPEAQADSYTIRARRENAEPYISLRI